MKKNHKFDKILKEYNEKHGHNYELPKNTSSVVIVHTLETNVFHVKYSDKAGLLSNKKSLGDFLYYHISSYIQKEDIQNIILSKENKLHEVKIEIWPSSKIRYAYLYTNYFMRNVGNLGKSCMRAKEMQKSLSFYTKNEVRVVVVTDNKNKIHARALLWNNIKSTSNKKTFTYLDRVYAESESLVSLFYDLAKENKWERYNGTSIGNAKSGLYKDNLDIIGMCHLPYTDTFRYLYYKDNLASSSSLSSEVKYKDDVICLTTTEDGGYFPNLDPDRTREAITGKYISKKDATYLKRYKGNYDGYVLKRNIANVGGVYYSTHDKAVVKTTLDEWILKENSVNEVITKDAINKITAVQSIEYNGYIHKSNAVNIKNKIYHKQDTNIVCFNNKWYHISQCFINYDRKEYNEELAHQKDVDAWFPFAEYLPYTTATIARTGDLIPKEHAIIAYDLAYNGATGDIEYQEVYCTGMDILIQLTTGELIVKSTQNKKYLKKFNNKWYIKQEFKLPDKKQLTFSFMNKEK